MVIKKVKDGYVIKFSSGRTEKCADLNFLGMWKGTSERLLEKRLDSITININITKNAKLQTNSNAN